MLSSLKSFGSNISSNYQISPGPAVLSGPWKVHTGKKKSTGTAASIFIFDRKSLDSRANALGSRSGSSMLKKLHDAVVERLKREAGNLARLRHPSVLQVLEPVEETRGGGLMFATEHVTASLAGLLHDKDEQETSARIGSRPSRYAADDPDGQRRRRDMEIDELEIQKGLLQIAKGLEFLHESAGLVHGNLTPDAIFINSKSDWKIAGLGFAGPPDSSDSRSSLPPLALSEALYHDPKLPKSVQLNLDYTSPDFALDSSVTTSADLFSLGLVIIALFNSPHVSPLQTHSSITSYKKLVTTPSTTPSQSNNFLSSQPIPRDILYHVLPGLITRRPAQRMNAREFQQSEYFDNILISTIRFLESLPAKTPNEKSQFMRGLQRVLPEFPASVLEKKILGVLLDETKDRELLPLILQNVFGILKRIPSGRRIFPEKIVPRLKEIFPTSPGKPAVHDSKRDAGLMILLENMSVVADNCSGRELKDGTRISFSKKDERLIDLDILPLLRMGLDSSTHTLVDAAIKCLPVILPILDFSTVKNEIFPPIASTFSRTNSLGIKVRCLEAFTVLCGGSMDGKADSDDLNGVTKDKTPSSKPSILDKYTIQEKLVPSLKAIKTKEPGVMMASLNVFREAGKICDSDFLALEVLPILWAFSLGPLLNVRQFGEFMSLIKSLSTKVEQEQTRKLQELSSGGDSSGFGGGESSSRAGSDLEQSDADGTKNDFERLVLGRSSTTRSTQDADPLGSLRSDSPISKQPTRGTSPTAFSWSSQAIGLTSKASNNMDIKRTPSTQTNNNHGFRSITPDYSMSSFPTLEPAPRQPTPVSQFPPLQPAPSSGSIWNTPSSPMPMGNQQPNIGNASSSSLAALATMRTNSSSSLSTQMSSQPQQTGNYSAFSIPPPPPPAPSFSSAFNTSTTSFGQGALPNRTPSQPSQTSQKQGLDKYDSLL